MHGISVPAQQLEVSRPTCWKTLDDYNNRMFPEIRSSCIIPDWLFIFILIFLYKLLMDNWDLTTANQQLQAAYDAKNFDLELANERFRDEIALLQQENDKLTDELTLRSTSSAATAQHPVSVFVPSDQCPLIRKSKQSAIFAQMTEHAQHTVKQSKKIVPQGFSTISAAFDNRPYQKMGLGRPLPGSIMFTRETRVDLAAPTTTKLLSGDFLTFYIGNLSYRATDATLKNSIEARMPISVDQSVVAYSSDGKSRGCAFVTVRWSDYLRAHSGTDPQLLVRQFCDSLTGKPLFGRPVFVELACNQRRGGS
jgi:hypothetical protein